MIGKTLLLILFLFLVTMPALAADRSTTSVPWVEIPLENNKTVAQGSEILGCGYAAMMNCLSLGGPDSRKLVKSLPGRNQEVQLKYLISTYGAKPSKEDGYGKRQKDDGIKPTDLLEAYGELRQTGNLPALKGSSLEREGNEPDMQMLTRIHDILKRSIKLQEPPIVLMLSHAAKWEPHYFALLQELMSGANPMERECTWRLTAGHFITVVGVPETVNGDGSFCLNYIDSKTGKKEQLLMHSDVRKFTGYAIGKYGRAWQKEGRWATATGSSLDVYTSKQPWSARTEIFATYAIYKE